MKVFQKKFKSLIINICILKKLYKVFQKENFSARFSRLV